MGRSNVRKAKTKNMQPDSYYNDGIFELARFGCNTLIKNNSTPEQRAEHMKYLSTEYHVKYKAISQKIHTIKEDVIRCDPYSLLMYIRNMALSTHMNVFSEFDHSSEVNAIIHAQEYIQSIIVSEENKHEPSLPDDTQKSSILKLFKILMNSIKNCCCSIISGLPIFKKQERLIATSSTILWKHSICIGFEEIVFKFSN